MKKLQKAKSMEKSKKRRSVSKQGRKAVKSSKGAPSVPTNTDWDDLDMDIDETMDYTLTQDKGSTEKGGSSEGTAKQQGTDKPKVSTDKPEVSTAKPKEVEVSTDKLDEGTAESKDGTSDESTAPTTIFKDDETIAEFLVFMSQNKAKQKGVEIKDVEESDRPKTTSTRSVLTLKPLPKIDPKDKGKKVLEEEVESDAESEGVNEAKRKFDQLAKDEEVARKIQEEWEAEVEKKRFAEEEATKVALTNEYDFIQARIEADRILAAKIQEEEREKFTFEEREKFLYDTIAAQRRFLAQQRAVAIRSRPLTRTQLINQMMTYLKHVGGKKYVDLKNKNFEEIQLLYEKVKRSDENFVAIDSAEDERHIKEMNEEAKDSKKKRVVKETPREEDTAKPDDDSDDENRKCLRIVTFDSTIDSEIMETKFFVSKPHKVSSPDGNYLVVYKANGHFRAFNYLMEIMMESLIEENDQDDFWNNQQEWEIVKWRLYEACGVCILELKDGTVIYMLVERRYPLSKELVCKRMLDLGLGFKRESTATLHFGKILKQHLKKVMLERKVGLSPSKRATEHVTGSQLTLLHSKELASPGSNSSWIEAIRLFLAYASFMGFIVYQMDVKSAFLYGTIGEEVYVCQPPSFEDPQFLDKVYKVEKALYGLHQAPRAWYETLSTYLLENGFRRGIIDKTLFIKKNQCDILLVQFDAQEVPDEFYRGAHFLLKVAGKALNKDEEAEDVDVHLYRLMIGSLMCLTASRPDIMFAVCTCVRDSPFDLEAFSDSDYARVAFDMEIPQQVELSFSLAKDLKFVHQHNMVACLERSDEDVDFHQIVDFLTTSSIHYALTQIHATVDGKTVVISEPSVMRDLYFNDEDGITCLKNTAIFENLALMGSKSTSWNEFSTNIASAVICLATSQKFNFSKIIFDDEAVHQELGDRMGEGSGSGPGRQETIGGAQAQTMSEGVPIPSQDPPLTTVNTVGRGNETYTSLTKRVLSLEETKTAQDRLITRLKLRVRRLEKKSKASTLQPMKRRLFKGRVENSSDKSLGKDASKQGRNDDNTKDLNLAEGANTEVIMEDKVSGEKGGSTADQVSAARPKVSAARPKVSDASVPVNVNAATPFTPPITTTIFDDEDLTIAQTLVKMRSEKAKKKGVAFRDVEETPRLVRSTTTLQPLPTIDPKDKGKGVVIEEEPVKVKRRDQWLAQIESDAELAQRIHEEELAELDRAQKERQKQEEATNAALVEEFDEIQARIDGDHELAKKETVGRRKSRGNKEQTTYKNLSQEHDDYLPQAYGQQQAEISKKRPRADSDEEILMDDIVIDVESMATKYPIVDWKTHILNENMMYYQIIRADGSSKNYKIFSEMLDDFDRQDVLDLHRLVQERYNTTSPEGYDLLLWGDLKTLFEPNEEDEI
ncbi:putative ribonuclease H-like domain-containing protein [Tanacetum coccineum]